MSATSAGPVKVHVLAPTSRWGANLERQERGAESPGCDSVVEDALADEPSGFNA